MSITTEKILAQQENAYAGRAEWLKSRGYTEGDVMTERDYDHMPYEYIVVLDESDEREITKRKVHLPENYQLIYGALE